MKRFLAFLLLGSTLIAAVPAPPISPYTGGTAAIGVDPSLNFQYLKVDSGGNLLTSGGGSGSTTANQGTSAAIVGGGWPIVNGEFATDTTGTFTNATQATSITTGSSIDGYATILVTVTGTYSAASGVFEMSDDGGTTWYSVAGVRSDSAIIEANYVSLTNTTRAWFVSVAGTDAFRVRSTAVASGTVNVRFSISAAPVGLQSTSQLAAGSNIIGALTANQSVNNTQVNGTTISVNSGAVDAGTQRVTLNNEQIQDLNITGQATQTVANNNIILAVAGASSTDCNGYRSITIGVTPTGTVSSGVVTFEGSADNVNFNTLELADVTTGTYSVVGSISPTTGVFRNLAGAVNYRYIRARISTVIGGGGSIQAFTKLSQTPYATPIMTIVQPTAANLNTTAVIASGTVTTVSTLSNTTQLTPGVAATNLGKAEDAASASGDTGVATWGVRRDVLTAQANATGDYNEMSVTKYGAHYTFDQEKNLPTYRASTAAGGIALVAAATDVAVLPGNATNTVYVTKIIISGVETTAGQVLVNIVKRSAANTAGSSAAMTAVPLDSADAAASSAPLSYTGNPTPGATVGIVDSSYVPFAPAATGTSLCTYTFNFGERGKGVKLSGTTQGLAVNLNGVTVTGGNAVITFEWREEP